MTIFEPCPICGKDLECIFGEDEEDILICCSKCRTNFDAQLVQYVALSKSNEE